MIDGITGIDPMHTSGKGAMFNDDTERLKADVMASTPLPITIDPEDEMMRGFRRFSSDMVENVKASEAPTVYDLINADGNLRSIVPNGFILLYNKLDSLEKGFSLKLGGGGGGFGIGGGVDTVGETTSSIKVGDVASSAAAVAIGTSISSSILPALSSLVGEISGLAIAITGGTLAVTALSKGVDTLAEKAMSEEKYQEMIDVQTEALKQGYLEFGGYDGATVSGPQWFTDWVAKSDMQFQSLSLKIQNAFKNAWNSPFKIPEEHDPQVVIPEAVAEFVENVGQGVSEAVPIGAQEAFDQGYIEFGDGTNDKGMAWLKGLFHKEEKLTKAVDNLTEAINTNTSATEVQTEVSAIQVQNSVIDPFHPTPNYVPATPEEVLKMKMAEGKGSGAVSVNLNNMYHNPNIEGMSYWARRANPNVWGSYQQLYTNPGTTADLIPMPNVYNMANYANTATTYAPVVVNY